MFPSDLARVTSNAFAADARGRARWLSLARDRRVRTVAGWVAVAWLPVLVDPEAVASAARLWPLATSGNPYFVADHWWLLYGWTPLVVISASIALLSPGLFFALACNAATSVSAWVVSALALSLVVVSSIAGLTQAILGDPLRGGAFIAVVGMCALGGLASWTWRLLRRPELAWPFDREQGTATLLSMIAAPWLLVIVLAPKFYWESFNGDGVHAYESARLLLAQALPFWPAEAGDIASFPGITSALFAYPASWFIRLFGELEVSARLPYLIFLPALCGVIIALAEFGRARVLGGVERSLIWLSLVVYTVAIGFSATYDPYSADLALPATQDTLAVVCFLGFILAALNHRWLWAALFAALTYTSLPIGILLIAMWLLAQLLLWEPRPWRDVLTAGAIVGACIAAGALLRFGLPVLELPTPGGEYAGGELLRRFAFLQWADWRRLAFIIVPAGIAPAMALLAWRAQDRISRSLTLVTIAYFVFFYVQARAALHHYVPAMLLPLVVLWRLESATPKRRFLMLAGTSAAGLIGLILSLPVDATPQMASRLIGMTIEDRLEGYERVAPEALRRSTLLHSLFPFDLEPAVPAESYGGAPLTWNYYAHQVAGGGRDVNYVMQAAADPSPPGMQAVARDEDAALYVKSDVVWSEHRAVRPPTPAGARIYAIPRELLFGQLPLRTGPPVLDVRRTLEAWGVDVEGILLRLGVRL